MQGTTRTAGLALAALHALVVTHASAGAQRAAASATSTPLVAYGAAGGLARGDARLARRVLGPAVQTLAEAYVEHRAEFDAIFARYPVATVDRGALAYIVLGCFSLDWDGLDFTASRGYRTERPQGRASDDDPPRADDPAPPPRAEYRESRVRVVGPATLAAFGDAWGVPRTASLDLGPEAVAVMLALRDGPRTAAELAAAAGEDGAAVAPLLASLERDGLVVRQDGRWVAVVPVLTAADSAMVADALRLSRKIMERWLAESYAPMRRQLAGLGAVRGGVPFDELFTDLWRDIVGLANRELVVAGVFADPYDPGRREQGVIPAVWTTGLVRMP